MKPQPRCQFRSHQNEVRCKPKRSDKGYNVNVSFVNFSKVFNTVKYKVLPCVDDNACISPKT